METQNLLNDPTYCRHEQYFHDKWDNMDLINQINSLEKLSVINLENLNQVPRKINAKKGKQIVRTVNMIFLIVWELNSENSK